MGAATSAVFLSYAAQDEGAARRICAALRAAGLDVWFDQSELRGGDAWDASIRRQIKDCALFMPIISASTDARGEGYFRLEWRLAVERSFLMADDQAFLLPVVIDDTLEASARVPDRFRERQWSRLAGGETSQEFVDQVKRALSAAAATVPSASAPRAATAAGPTRRRWIWTAAALATVVAVATIVVAVGMRTAKVASNVPAVTATAANLATPSRKSIAVLPFQNLTGRTEDAYLADGLQEEILNALARMRDLKVISRTSVSEFHSSTTNVREVGERLGVGSVLEGSVRREGNTLRLTIQLVDARNDRHVLAADYDRDLGHVLGLQSEVARKVADALSATLSAYERGALDRVATNSGDAYNLYLRALARWRQPAPDGSVGVEESKQLLEQALRFDPDYTDALALLSQAYTWKFFAFRHGADGGSARTYYERALALDPQLPEALLARGLYEMYVAADLDRALSDLGKVVRLRPNAAEAQMTLGFVLRRRGQFDEALVHLARASDLDPLNHAYDSGVFETMQGLRRYPEVIEQTELYLRRFPDEALVYFVRARAACQIQRSVAPLRQAFRDHANALNPADRKSEEAALALAEGRYLDAARLWASTPPSGQDGPIDRNLRIGFLYQAGGQTRNAERNFRAAEHDARASLQREPNVLDVQQTLALAQSMLGDHAAAIATIEATRTVDPESLDQINGPQVSFVRSIILVRAGRAEEGYAELKRLLRVPFGVPVDLLNNGTAELLLPVRDDPHYGDLVKYPPRL